MFISNVFDREFMASMTGNPRWATRYTTQELVEQAGTQGVELLNWLVARDALPDPSHAVAANYHIRISNTAAGLLALA